MLCWFARSLLPHKIAVVNNRRSLPVESQWLKLMTKFCTRQKRKCSKQSSSNPALLFHLSCKISGNVKVIYCWHNLMLSPFSQFKRRSRSELINSIDIKTFLQTVCLIRDYHVVHNLLFSTTAGGMLLKRGTGNEEWEIEKGNWIAFLH